MKTFGSGMYGFARYTSGWRSSAWHRKLVPARGAPPMMNAGRAPSVIDRPDVRPRAPLERVGRGDVGANADAADGAEEHHVGAQPHLVDDLAVEVHREVRQHRRGAAARHGE